MKMLKISTSVSVNNSFFTNIICYLKNHSQVFFFFIFLFEFYFFKQLLNKCQFRVFFWSKSIYRIFGVHNQLRLFVGVEKTKLDTLYDTRSSFPLKCHCFKLVDCRPATKQSG